MESQRDDSAEGAGMPLKGHHRTSSMHVFDSVHAYEDPEGAYAVKDKVTRWWRGQKGEWRRKSYTYSWIDWLTVMFPCLAWLRTYSVKNSLAMDITAGVSIGFMVVPQGMSYALLAGLPPVWGLYGAFVSCFIYALFGSSRHLAVGPVAVTSLLLGSAIHEMVPAANDIEDASDVPANLEAVQAEYNTVALQITFLVGVLWFIVGALQLGFLARFLSHSVISGFTTGAALTIGLSQLKYVLGIKIPRTDTALKNVIELVHNLGGTKWREVIMGFAFLALLLAMKYLGKRYKRLAWMRPLGPMTVCVLAIVINVAGDLDGKELIKSVGSVPKGLPSATISQWLPLEHGGRQLYTAVIVFLVDFMESLSIAKAIGRRHNYEIVVNKEIVAMGLANLMGGAFNCYTTTGSFSRTAVSSEVGARTPLQGIFTGTLVMLVLLFITPVFERLTYNATAAIILSSVFGLFEISEALHLFRVHFLDFLVWSAAFLGTIFAGVEIGLGIAIGLAIFLVVYRSAFPHTAVLGQLPETEVYRNIKQYPSATQTPYICVVRVDAPIYFANVDWVRDRIRKYAARSNGDEKLGPVRYVVLDMAPISYVDSTGMRSLRELVQELKNAGQQLVLANPSREMQALLKRAKLLDDIGQSWVFVRTADAVNMCVKSLREESEASKSVSMPTPPEQIAV